MGKIVTTVTVLTVALGVAACANMPSSDVTQTATASPSPQSAASLTYYNGTISPFDSGIADNPAVPGATGRTIVPGDNSTIDGDSMDTQMERSGEIGSGGN